MGFEGWSTTRFYLRQLLSGIIIDFSILTATIYKLDQAKATKDDTKGLMASSFIVTANRLLEGTEDDKDNKMMASA